MNIYIEHLPRARADIACALYLSTCFRNQKNETGCLYLHYAFFPDLFSVKWALYMCMSSLIHQNCVLLRWSLNKYSAYIISH